MYCYGSDILAIFLHRVVQGIEEVISHTNVDVRWRFKDLFLGAGYTVEIGPLSAALSASIYRICELIKTAARWRIMKKI